jgi:hypothetical protein
MRYNFAAAAVLLFILSSPVTNAQKLWELVSYPGTEIDVFHRFEEFVYAGSPTGNIYRTSDRGDTWENLGAPEPYKVKAFASTKEYLFAGLESGIFKFNTNDKTWDKVSFRNTKSLIYWHYPGDTVSCIISAGNAGIYITTDDGNTWNPLYTSGPIETVAGKPGGVLAAYHNNTIYRSIDSGVTWDIALGTPPTFGSVLTVAVSPDNDILNVFYNNLRRSTNGGTTWLFTPAPTYGYIITDVKSRYYIYNYVSGLIYNSVNKGERWYSYDIGISLGPVRDLYIDDSGFGYVSVNGNNIYRTIYNCFAPPRCSLIAPTIREVNAPLQLSLHWGASYTAEGYFYQVGESPEMEDSTILFSGVVSDTTVTVGPLESDKYYWWRAYAFNSYGRTQWSETWKFKTTSISSAENRKDLEYKLYHNYPNPFNPSTRIKYSVAENSYVQIKIYDTIGNEVIVLADEQKSPGIYEAEWLPGKNISSGLYIYKITAGKFNAVGKMMFLK